MVRIVSLLRLPFICGVRHYRKQIKELLGLPKNKKTNIERILVILTESGTIYCLLWVGYSSIAKYVWD
jgi:transcription initiation factor IIE alpha subunit